jgi:hypothetical protein
VADKDERDEVRARNKDLEGMVFKQVSRTQMNFIWSGVWKGRYKGSKVGSGSGFRIEGIGVVWYTMCHRHARADGLASAGPW